MVFLMAIHARVQGHRAGRMVLSSHQQDGYVSIVFWIFLREPANLQRFNGCRSAEFAGLYLVHGMIYGG